MTRLLKSEQVFKTLGIIHLPTLKIVTKQNWASHTTRLKITHYQTLKFRSNFFVVFNLGGKICNKLMTERLQITLQVLVTFFIFINKYLLLLLTPGNMVHALESRHLGVY